jgi:hypothetical protein
MPLTNYGAQKLLGSLFGANAFSVPGTLYIGLFTATPSNLGGGTEVSSGGYARVALVNSGANWTGATNTWPSISANAGTVAFPSATGNWGVVGWFGIFDAASGGNLIWWGPLSTGVNVPSGDIYEFTAGNLQLTLG